MDEIGDATTDVGTCLGDQVIALVWQDGVDQTKCPYVRRILYYSLQMCWPVHHDFLLPFLQSLPFSLVFPNLLPSHLHASALL